MGSIDSVWLEEVEVGDDSKSGMAVNCIIEGEEYWIPYSIIRKIERNLRVTGNDRVEVEWWWAKEKELAE